MSVEAIPNAPVQAVNLEAMRWAFTAEGVDTTPKMVLLILAGHAGKDCQCWPSVARLAALGGMSERAARSSIRSLEKAGLVRSDRRGRSRTYTLLMPAAPVVAAVADQHRQGVPMSGPAIPAPAAGVAADRQDVPVSQAAEPANDALTPAPRAPEQKEERKKESKSSLRSLHDTKPDLAEFEAWWQAYPRKVGKGDARKAYAKACKHGATPAELLYAIKRQRWSDNPRYRPFPATWLNKERWQDDPQAAAPMEPRKPSLNERLMQIVGLLPDGPLETGSDPVSTIYEAEPHSWTRGLLQ